MKKTISYFILALLSFILFSVAPVTDYYYASAARESEIENELNEEIDDNLSSLIGGELESYFDNLKESFGGKSLKELLKSIIDGEQPVRLDTLLNLFFDSFKSGLKSSILSMVSIIILAVLGSLSSSLTAGFKKEGTKQIIHYAVYGAIICSVAIMVGDMVSTAVSALNSVSSLLDAVFPILITLLTALGGVSGASVLEPITLVLSNLVLKIILNLIVPMFTATVVFTFVGNLTDTVKLDKLTKTFKSISNWTLGIVFSLLTTFVAMQGMVGASIDTITVKSAKFALSSYIPILGGYLSEGFDIVMASCVLIKNALGLSVFLILISVMIAPILKIILFSLALKLISGFIEPIGETKVSSLLYDTATHLNVLVACLGGVCFIVFILMLLIIGSFNGGIA